MQYGKFIAAKSHLSGEFGFDPIFMHDKCYPFQASLIEWAVRHGRGAIFADCGLGKTIMQLTWAQNVYLKTGKPVLILSPLSVSLQTVEEAHKFGFDCARSQTGNIKSPIVTSNYERVHMFDADAFSGVVCDESSILKNFNGARREEITAFMRQVKYRLLCTATAAPNDYLELGTSSEALGQLGHMDMLGRFFVNNEGSLNPAFHGAQWRFKHHAERDFWRWVCSWARACRKPSDLGFDDGPFILPDLVEIETPVRSPSLPGFLFPVKAITLDEQREERRATIGLRCEAAASALDHDRPGVAWCQLNAEADMLTKLISGSVQVSGADHEDRKEEVFTSFRRGEIKKIVTKPKIAAFGMNWQHCSDMTFFPDHSFEQYYQATRRMWRFGQRNNVVVHNIVSEANSGVSANLRRKAVACERMFAEMVSFMNDALRVHAAKDHNAKTEVPQWLQ